MAENKRGRGVAGVVLAGGASTRMGRVKALAPLRGRPLALWALDRLAPQCAAVYLNVRQITPALAALGAELVEDAPAHRGAGPLAGIGAALARAEADGFGWLVTTPCDAPFAPADLVARLAASGRAATGVSSGGWEPMFALWPVSARPAVEAALAQGRGSPRGVLETLGAAEVSFPDEVFANLNTPQDMAAAHVAADLVEALTPAAAGPVGVDR